MKRRLPGLLMRKTLPLEIPALSIPLRVHGISQ